MTHTFKKAVLLTLVTVASLSGAAFDSSVAQFCTFSSVKGSLAPIAMLIANSVVQNRSSLNRAAVLTLKTKAGVKAAGSKLLADFNPTEVRDYTVKTVELKAAADIKFAKDAELDAATVALLAKADDQTLVTPAVVEVKEVKEVKGSGKTGEKGYVAPVAPVAPVAAAKAKAAKAIDIKKDAVLVVGGKEKTVKGRFFSKGGDLSKTARAKSAMAVATDVVLFYAIVNTIRDIVSK